MAAVHEPLAPEAARTGRASLLHDDLGRMPEDHAVSGQVAVDDGFPETVLVERLRPLEQRSFVGRVVSRQVETLVPLERKHVPRIPAEVLGPVGRAQLLARIDPTGDGVETAMELPDGLDPGQSGQHLTDRQHDDLAGRPIDAFPPELRNESSRPLGKHGPGVAAAQLGWAFLRLADEHLDSISLRFESGEAGSQGRRRPCRSHNNGERRPCLRHA